MSMHLPKVLVLSTVAIVASCTESAGTLEDAGPQQGIQQVIVTPLPLLTSTDTRSVFLGPGGRNVEVTTTLVLGFPTNVTWFEPFERVATIGPLTEWVALVQGEPISIVLEGQRANLTADMGRLAPL